MYRLECPCVKTAPGICANFLGRINKIKIDKSISSHVIFPPCSFTLQPTIFLFHFSIDSPHFHALSQYSSYDNPSPTPPPPPPLCAQYHTPHSTSSSHFLYTPFSHSLPNSPLLLLRYMHVTSTPFFLTLLRRHLRSIIQLTARHFLVVLSLYFYLFNLA